LSFDLRERPGRRAGTSADVVVSTDTAAANALIFKTSPAYELNLYVIHGILHLLGYDDRSARQRKKMRQRENKYVYS